MLSRAVFRAASQRAALARTSMRSAAIHSSAPVASEEGKESAKTPYLAPEALQKEGLLAQFGLDDWKISAPIAAALAIPLINNGVYVINEETQLACCFFLFGTSLYKYGGDMIASYFDDAAAAILREHNEVEDSNLSLAKETLQTHESLLQIHEDVAAVAEAHKEAVDLMCQVQAYKLRHKTREAFIRNLESIRETETSYNQLLQKDMIASSTAKVRAIIEKGDKSLKSAAFKNALDILSDAKVDDSKEDDVAVLFVKELRSYASELEAKEGQTIKLSAEEQKELQADLDAYAKRFDLESAELKAADEIKVKLM